MTSPNRQHDDQNPEYEGKSSHKNKLLKINENRELKAEALNIICNGISQEESRVERRAFEIHDRICCVQELLGEVRLAVVSNLYGRTECLVQEPVPVEGQTRIHPAVKKLLGIRGRKPNLNQPKKELGSSPILVEKTGRPTAPEATPALVKHEPRSEGKPVNPYTKPRPHTGPRSHTEPRSHTTKKPTPASSTSVEISKFPRYLPPKLKEDAHTPRAVSGTTTVLRRLIVGNVSRWLPADTREDKATHKWMMYIRIKDVPNSSRYITKVRYLLDPSYKPNDLVEVTSPPFYLTRRGWGEFPVRVQIHFAHPDDRPLDVRHCLKLDTTYSGQENLGSETLVDVHLHLDSETGDNPSEPNEDATNLAAQLNSDNPDSGFADKANSGLSRIKSEPVSPLANKRGSENLVSVKQESDDLEPDKSPSLEPPLNKKIKIEVIDEPESEHVVGALAHDRVGVVPNVSDSNAGSGLDIFYGDLDTFTDSFPIKEEIVETTEEIDDVPMSNADLPVASCPPLTKPVVTKADSFSIKEEIVETTEEIDDVPMSNADLPVASCPPLTKPVVTKADSFSIKEEIVETTEEIDDVPMSNADLPVASCPPLTKPVVTKADSFSIKEEIVETTEEIDDVPMSNADLPVVSCPPLTKPVVKKADCVNLVPLVQPIQAKTSSNDKAKTVLLGRPTPFKPLQTKTATVGQKVVLKTCDPSKGNEGGEETVVVKCLHQNGKTVFMTLTKDVANVLLSKGFKGLTKPIPTQQGPAAPSNPTSLLKSAQTFAATVPNGTIVKTLVPEAARSSNAPNSHKPTTQHTNATNSAVARPKKTSFPVLMVKGRPFIVENKTLVTSEGGVSPRAGTSLLRSNVVPPPLVDIKREPLSEEDRLIYSGRTVVVKKTLGRPPNPVQCRDPNIIRWQNIVSKAIARPMFEDMVHAVRWFVRHFPIVHPSASESSFKSLYPYSAPSIDAFLQWLQPKQRATEWLRAKTVHRALVAAGYPPARVWSTKAICLWAREHGYVPTVPDAGQRRTGDDPPSTTLSERDDVAEWMLANLASYTDGHHRDDAAEVDVIGWAPPSRPVVKAEPGVSSADQHVEMMEMSHEMQLQCCHIAESARQLGVRFEPEPIVPGTLYGAAERVVLEALKSFTEDLLRRSLAQAWERNSYRAPASITPGDVKAAILDRPEFDILTNSGIGVQPMDTG